MSFAVTELMRRLALCAALSFLLSFAGCQGDQFSVQMFTFPSDIPAHEEGWEYRGVITVSTAASGSMFNRSDKTVRISILGVDGSELFDSNQKFDNVSGVKATIEWTVAEELSITLMEHGSDNVADEYSQRLARSGDLSLQVIRLRLDRETRRFLVPTTQ